MYECTRACVPNFLWKEVYFSSPGYRLYCQYATVKNITSITTTTHGDLLERYDYSHCFINSLSLIVFGTEQLFSLWFIVIVTRP